nr:hypothetical protein [uncultured Carboxylicivirga sp.]
MKIQLILILFFLLSGKVYSQSILTDSLKIGFCNLDSTIGIQIFPENILSENYKIIVTGNESFANKKTAIELFWHSSLIDGIYCVIISPKQIYLRSEHNNPNPDFLYWVTDINKEQFDLIIKNFINSPTSNLLELKNENSPFQTYTFDYEIENYVNDKWENHLYKNFKTIITSINSAILSTGQEINIPKKEKLERNSIRLVVNIEEYTTLSDIKELESDTITFIE